MPAAKPIPEGFRTITPSLVVSDAAGAIELYKKAFGATEDYVMKTPDGKVMHASLNIGDSKLFLCDTMPGEGCSTPSVSSFYLYLKDVDTSFTKAKQAGLESKYEPTDMFWGDRTGTLKDKYGVMWTLATHVKDVSDDEMKKGAEEFNKQMAAKKAA